GKGTLTLATAEDTALATLRHIGGDGANVATVDQPIMRTIRIGTRLAPVLGFSHGSDLRSSGGVLHTDRKFGLFSGFDHGAGHPLLLLYDAKISRGENINNFNSLYYDPFIVFTSLL